MAEHQVVVGHRRVEIGSPRAFGIVFAGAFLLIAILPLRHGGDVRLWALLVSGLFLLVSLVAPRLLQPLNIIWFRVGLLLHKIVNPILMMLIFLISVVPVGLLLKSLGKDPLHLKKDPQAKSYWISRPPASPAPGSMARQF